PPETTVSGIPGGWVSRDVTVTLTATDPAGSGVSNTYYALNGGVGNLYSLPVTVSVEGTTTFGYWSVDASSNAETSHTANVLIDKSVPIGLSLSSSTHVASTPTSATTLTVSFSGATDVYSGVAGYSVLVTTSATDDPDTVIDQSAATTSTPPLADGTWYLAVRAIDSAGNAGGVVRFGPVVIDTVAPSGTFAVANGAALTTTTAVSLDSTVTGALEMRFDAGAGYSAWVAYAAATSTALPAGDGVKTVTAQYRDAAGNATSVVDTITLDTVAPSGTFAVANGAALTTTTAVLLDSAVTGALEMRFDAGAGYSAWVAYAAATSTALPAGDGTKTVTAEYRDAVGNAASVVDTITLDTTPPGGTFAVANGAALTTTTAVSLDSTVTGALEMRFDAGAGYSAWVAYAAATSTALPAGDGTKTVTAQYRDAAGNATSTVDTITLDVSGPSGSLFAAWGSEWTSSTLVAVMLASPDAIEMRLDGGSGFSAWTTFATDATVTVPAGDGTKTVTAQYRDAAGNTASVVDTITLDATPPGGTFAVANGAALTSSTAVSLDSAVTGAAQMRFDAGAGYSAWVAYAAATSTALPAGDGVKTVTAQYRDAAGNATSVVDTITLDTTAPSGSITVASGSAWTSSTLVAVTLASSDAIDMRIDGGSGLGAWTAFATATTTVLPAGDGVKTVTAQYRDAAGNIATVTDTITLDTAAPSGTLAVQAGSAFATSTAVSLDSAVTGAAQMRFDAGAGYSAWVAYAAATSTVLPAGDGVKTVIAQFRDAAGNTASVTDTITLDTVAPSGTFAVADGAALTSSTTVSLDSTVTGALEMRFDAGAGYSAWVAYAAATSTVLPAGDGVRTVTAQYRDAAGNAASVTDTITLDTTAPSPPGSVSWTAVTTDSVTLVWGAGSDAAGISGYQVCDGSGSAMGASAATTTRVGGLTAGGVYDFSIRTVDLAGRVSSPSSVLRVTLPRDVARAAVATGTGVEASGAVRVNGRDTTFGVEFSQVTTAGVVEVSVLSDPPNTEGVVGFRVVGSYFDIRFSGTFDGFIDITLPYDPSISDARALDLQIQHWSGGRWVDCTVSRDLVAHTITGRVQSLSPFTVVEELPPDTTPPAAVSSMTAVARRGGVDLAWSVVDTSTTAMRVLRSTSGHATSPTVTVTQSRLYEGTSTAMVDTDIVDLATYFYTAFARDAVGNWSLAATASATAVGSGPRAGVILTLAGPVSTVDVGRQFTLTGGMTDASGAPVPTRDVILETQVGTRWVRVATLTPFGSAYRRTLTATATVSFRLSFAGDVSLETTVSPTLRVVVRPRAALSVPSASSIVRRRTAFTVTGLLLPRHRAGAYSVQLRIMRYVSGRWVLYRTVWVRNVDYGVRSRYSVRVSLPYTGSWRILAYHADAGHVANTSGPRAVRVR
ncbi:MAG: fibronectin type III domain-containing protein, partial [Coriobacteriia bacterium]